MSQAPSPAADIDGILQAFRRFRSAVMLQGGADWTELDLSMAQLKAIFVLDKAGGSLTVSGFADKAGTKPSAASLLIDRLVQSGYMQRHQDEEDRRRAIIVLSAKGKSLLERLHRERPARLRRVLELLAPEEIASLAKGMAALASAAEHLSGPAHPALEGERADGRGREKGRKREPKGTAEGKV